jgi:PelA/Pel-15E family pectate lyase
MHNIVSRGRSLVAAMVFVTVAGAATARPADYLEREAEWFESAGGRAVVENVLAWQTADGAWPKNVDTTGVVPGKGPGIGTFDNGATINELRLLAKAYRATGEARYLAALERGLDSVLDSQYSNGGWPQRPRPGKGYHRYITFNDNVMTHLLSLVRDVAASPEFEILDSSRRQKAKQALARGLDCVLRCQVRLDGKLTVWCQQHDEKELTPRPGRAYEPVALASSESVRVTRFLMSLPEPSREVRDAVEGAVEWFRAVAITGVRYGRRELLQGEPQDMLWARFYESPSLRPVFGDRDRSIHYRLEEISEERRLGYSWYGTYPHTLLEEEYPAWK